jgi:phenylacetate-CoA ligase
MGPADAMAAIDEHAVHALDRAPAEVRLAWQTRQLHRLLQFVRDTSALWREALPPDALRARADDLSALPIIGRAALRERIEQGGALPTPPSHGRAMFGSTSGSTGMPLRFHATELAQRLTQNQYWADHARQGRDMWRRWAVVGPQVAAHPGHPHADIPANPWRQAGPGLHRNTEGLPIADTASWITRMAPAYLFIYPTLLTSMLDAWESGLPAPAGLEQVTTFSTTVEPALRERTRRVLGASIRDRYSCEELGPLAMQCPHDETRYHVSVSNVIIEVVDDSGAACAPGETGRVLVTGLHHWASPVIRYDIGDVAALHPTCSCGAALPSISQLLGRRRSLIRTAAGEARFVRLTTLDWLDIAPVREFRLIQQDLQSLRLELVVAEPLTASQHAALQALLARRIDPALRYDIVELGAIDWPPGRKRQDVVGLG